MTWGNVCVKREWKGKLTLTAPTDRNNKVSVMEVVWYREERKSRREDPKRSTVTDNVMGRAVELRLKVDEGERHAEKVQGVTSPGQPAKNRYPS